MRRLSVLVLGAAALAGATGCSGGNEDGDTRRVGPLSWTDPPRVVRPGRLKSDRVMIGTVRNDSSRDVTLAAEDVGIRDRDGRRLPGNARFAAAFAHGLYGAYQRPDPLPPNELRRLGLTVSIRPGETAPLVVAYRLKRTTQPPLRVDYGNGLLPVPRRVASGRGPG